MQIATFLNTKLKLLDWIQPAFLRYFVHCVEVDAHLSMAVSHSLNINNYSSSSCFFFSELLSWMHRAKTVRSISYDRGATATMRTKKVNCNMQQHVCRNLMTHRESIHCWIALLMSSIFILSVYSRSIIVTRREKRTHTYRYRQKVVYCMLDMPNSSTAFYYSLIYVCTTACSRIRRVSCQSVVCTNHGIISVFREFCFN